MPPDIDTYADWIKAGAHLDLLRRNALADELIIYASGDYTFVHAVVVPEDAINALNVDELFDCSSDPHDAVAGYCWGGGRDDVWIERSQAISGSKTLKGSRQLLFARTIPESVDRERLYYEVSQEYAHITEIHFLREHDAYCRFDKHGDLEHVVSLTTKSPQEVSLVTFKRDPLEEYLAANSSVLVRMFDFNTIESIRLHGVARYAGRPRPRTKPLLPSEGRRETRCLHEWGSDHLTEEDAYRAICRNKGRAHRRWFPAVRGIHSIGLAKQERH